MLIGYARVSTLEQTTDLQMDALKTAGCERIFTEQASGAKADRKELKRCLGDLRRGDVLVIWKLDRLARSLQHLVDIVANLDKCGVGLKCLTEPVDTTSPQGTLILHLFGALAQFERSLIRERVMAGLNAAWARGKRSGRKFKVTPKKRDEAIRLIKVEGKNMTQVAKELRICRTALYDARKREPELWAAP